MCKLKFCWFKIWMTSNDKNRKESTRIEIISKSEIQSWKNFLKFKQLTFCVLRSIQIYLHRMYCAGVEHAAKHFAVNHRGHDCGSAVRFNGVSWHFSGLNFQQNLIFLRFRHMCKPFFLISSSLTGGVSALFWSFKKSKPRSNEGNSSARKNLLSIFRDKNDWLGLRAYAGAVRRQAPYVRCLPGGVIKNSAWPITVHD